MHSVKTAVEESPEEGSVWPQFVVYQCISVSVYQFNGVTDSTALRLLKHEVFRSAVVRVGLLPLIHGSRSIVMPICTSVQQRIS